MAGMTIAMALLVVGTGFIVLGVTFLPLIGILIGVAILGLASHFITLKGSAFKHIACFLVPDNDVIFHPSHCLGKHAR